MAAIRFLSGNQLNFYYQPMDDLDSTCALCFTRNDKLHITPLDDLDAILHVRVRL